MKRNTNWLNNRNATKNPKLYQVTVYRDSAGELHLLGDKTLVLERRAGKEGFERVNTRAFGRMLNKQGVNFR